MPRMQPSSPIPGELSARQFSLRMLFAVLTLASLVAAAFALGRGPFPGIFTYLAGLLLLLSYWRHCTLRSLIDRPDPPPHLRLADPGLIVLATIGTALAAAVAFCCTCTAAQLPFVRGIAFGDPEQAAAAERLFHAGLLFSIPCGTLAVAFVYWAFWPRSTPP